MIVSDTLEHSERLPLSNNAPPSAKSSITVTSYEGLFNNLFGLTSKTILKLRIIVREINRRPVAPLTKAMMRRANRCLAFIYQAVAVLNILTMDWETVCLYKLVIG